MNLAVAVTTLGPNAPANRARICEFAPSAAITRSYSPLSSVLSRSSGWTGAENLRAPPAPAGHRGRPVAANPPALAAQPQLDRIPVHAVLGQRAAEHRIGRVDAVQGGVGKHHAEAERVASPVALEYGDFTGRVAALGQQRREQAAGAAAEDRYPHLSSSTRCFILLTSAV